MNWLQGILFKLGLWCEVITILGIMNYLQGILFELGLWCEVITILGSSRRVKMKYRKTLGS